MGKAKACELGQTFRVPEVIHITCNTGARDSPDMYALSPWALGMHIRQIPRAYVTTITCTYKIT